MAVAQHMQALELANHIRLEGSRIRRSMGSLPSPQSRRRAAELLLDPPAAIAHMRLGHFLSGIQRFGRYKAMRYMQEAGLTAGAWDRPLGPLENRRRYPSRIPLTERQRGALAAVLAEGL